MSHTNSIDMLDQLHTKYKQVEEHSSVDITLVSSHSWISPVDKVTPLWSKCVRAEIRHNEVTVWDKQACLLQSVFICLTLLSLTKSWASAAQANLASRPLFVNLHMQCICSGTASRPEWPDFPAYNGAYSMNVCKENCSMVNERSLCLLNWSKVFQYEKHQIV